MKLKKMTDEEVMNTFVEMLSDRVTLNTAFVVDNDSGNITHQIVRISCGELISMSQPEALEVILRPATAVEQGATVN